MIGFNKEKNLDKLNLNKFKISFKKESKNFYKLFHYLLA